MAWCIAGSNTAKPALPPAFAMYIATSALRTMSAAPSTASRAPATPMLAEMLTDCPPMAYGARSSRTSRSAMLRALRRSGRSSVSTANSSPPRRATRSPSRTRPPIRSVMATSRSSPAAWPMVSFTILKSSMSMNSTAATVSRRSPSTATTRSRVSWNERRLATPVSASSSARSWTRRSSTEFRKLSAAIPAAWATTLMTRRSTPGALPGCSSTRAPIGRPSATIGATMTRPPCGIRAPSAGLVEASSRRTAIGDRICQARSRIGSTATAARAAASGSPRLPRTTIPSSTTPSAMPRGNAYRSASPSSTNDACLNRSPSSSSRVPMATSDSRSTRRCRSSRSFRALNRDVARANSQNAAMLMNGSPPTAGTPGCTSTGGSRAAACAYRTTSTSSECHSAILSPVR